MSKLFAYLSYRDVDWAITWLEALGFETTTRQTAGRRRRHRPRGAPAGRRGGDGRSGR
ncbi:MAG TPA: hypothetical protein VFY33_00615 [Solirubrobacterales bacterium]|nr:hypothetical protein [Solirubrobacterales bacterium]